MSSPKKNFLKSCVPQYVPKDLKWCKRDDLLTNIDQLKYSHFSDDPNSSISCNKVLNFDMICKDVGRYSEQSKPTRFYQTVTNSYVKKMLKSEKDKAVAACLRSDSPDIC